MKKHTRKHRTVKHTLKRPVKQAAKRMRVWYKKSPLIVVIASVVIFGTLCSGIYSLYHANSWHPAVTTTGLDTLEKPTSEVAEPDTDYQTSKDEDEPEKPSLKKMKSSPSPTPIAPSKQSTPSRNAPADNSPQEEEWDDKLTSSAYSVQLGGEAGVTTKYLNIRSAFGKKIFGLSVSNKSSIETAQKYFYLGGLSVRESPLTDGTDVYVSVRDLMIQYSHISSSGGTTVYVFAGYGVKPVAIKVSWSPTA